MWYPFQFCIQSHFWRFTGPVMEPRRTPYMTSCQSDVTPFTTIFYVWHINQLLTLSISQGDIHPEISPWYFSWCLRNIHYWTTCPMCKCHTLPEAGQSHLGAVSGLDVKWLSFPTKKHIWDVVKLPKGAASLYMMELKMKKLILLLNTINVCFLA